MPIASRSCSIAWTTCTCADTTSAGARAVLLAGVIDRIDRLKDELVSAADYAAWAEALPTEDDAARDRAAREVEFARLYLDHDRLLAEEGALDAGELVLRAIAMLRERPHVRARVAERYRHVLVDEFADLGFAAALLVELLAAEHGSITVAADDDQAARRLRAAAAKNVRDFEAAHPDAAVVRLETSQRCPQRVLDAAAAVVEPIPGRRAAPVAGAPGGTVRFWQADDERAQAQAVAAEVERLIRAGCEPERIGVLVRSLRDEGRDVGVAFEERAIGFRTVGEADFFAQTEVRDVLAWMRLLADPNDAGAVVRALGRPPVSLRSVDLARCVQIARRRKLDMVSALVAGDQIARGFHPRGRAHQRVPQLYRESASTLDSGPADLFVHRLVDRLGLRRRGLHARPDGVERLCTSRGSGSSRPPTRAARRTPRHATSRATPPPWRRRVARRGRRAAARGRRAGHGSRRGRRARAGLGLRARPDVGADAGARLRAAEPIPDALLRETLGPDDRAAHVASMRRLLHVAMTRAARGLVLAYPARAASGALQPPSPFAEEARVALGANGSCSRRSCSVRPRRCMRRSRRCATSCWRTSHGSARASATCAWTPTSTSRTRWRATSSS